VIIIETHIQNEELLFVKAGGTYSYHWTLRVNIGKGVAYKFLSSELGRAEGLFCDS
jgi:hypothetical protein